MAVDKSYGLIELHPLEGQEGFSVKVVTKAEPRQETFKNGDELKKREARFSGKEDSLLKCGHESLCSYVVKVHEKDHIKALAMVDVLDLLAIDTEEKLGNLAHQVYDLHTTGGLKFGTIVELPSGNDADFLISSL